jgi:hypothetical protein
VKPGKVNKNMARIMISDSSNSGSSDDMDLEEYGE